MRYEELHKIIIDNIHNTRITNGITQDQLAERMGYRSRTSISKIENGRNLTLKSLLKYADALGVDFMELLKKQTLLIKCEVQLCS